MTVLVTGSANSGKSAVAEDLAMKTGDTYRYYVATMKVIDEEGRIRVRKHRQQREGKGFETIECKMNIGDIAGTLLHPDDSVILLECVSNLVGNVMHDSGRLKRLEDDPGYFDILADEIASDIRRLSEAADNMVIVTNDYGYEDGYDEETRMYVKLLDLVNDRLRKVCDRTIDMKKEEKS